ncbi:S-adenosyl-l-methionine hydroxide adenosyltransferase family protein [Actinomadura sp. WMMB 499]|uniref:SAM hydrolase/SAM-dependent halogenase family protein n=1 Tax=Actinomadura sp. WMMB 499 TaxID=1219491 RepID=UPI00124677E8|nr:SAM-dependent chlorinase/fluorinase [Actinomadura sp. WMMB 499]QFG25359.1 SAM-dependent chlorinase/fluorinase [Actinomadura sp. WMMB 499]
MPDSRPFVSLATDFGDAYTSVCAGVIYTIVPDANVLVLSDEITPFGVREGAMLLRQSLPYLPVGVHVGIVDPGVGTPRLPVALVTGRGDVLVGPDNGLLVPAAGALGGVAAAHVLEDPAYRLPSVSASFHGRDVFSPAAAHIAAGVAVAGFGPAVEPMPLNVPAPAVAEGALTVPVLYTDRFGSLVLGAEPADLAAALGAPPGPGTPLDVAWTGPDGDARTARVPFAETFGGVPPGSALLWTDSSGWLGLAVNQGSAAEALGLAGATSITLRRVPVS